jgi:thioredoxin reductase (NADPH)
VTDAHRVEQRAGHPVTTDLLVVGAGPVGLFATYYAGFRGLRVNLVDSQPEAGGQITALYPAKTVHDVAGFPGIAGSDLVAGLLAQARMYEPRIRFDAKIAGLAGAGDGAALVATLTDGSTIEARAVVLATGVGGMQPRTLPTGHEWHGRGVTYLVADPAAHAGEDVVVVGGGDSALDWALALRPVARSVTVVHRRRAFRAHAGSLNRAREAGIVLLTECEIQAVNGDHRVRSVDLRDSSGGVREIPADTVVGALGQITEHSPFAAWGLELQGARIVVDHAMQTSVARVFAVGDASTYRGKVALMATGFGEAATAVNHAAVLIDPELSLLPGHSTDDDLEPPSWTHPGPGR